jgi:hypothetical protein
MISDASENFTSAGLIRPALSPLNPVGYAGR